MMEAAVVPSSRTCESTLFVASPLPRAAMDALRVACRKSDFSLDAACDEAEAVEALSSASVRAVVIDAERPGAREVCAELRRNPLRAHVPIFAVARAPSEITFVEAFGWGADDVVAESDLDALTARLRSLHDVAPSRAPRLRGRAVVASGDAFRRALVARVLRCAGYDVRFACDGIEIRESLSAGPVALVFADLDLPPRGALDDLRRCRVEDATRDVPWVLATSPRAMHELRAALAKDARTALYDAFSPAENVLFLANELASGALAEQRATRRLLYGTRVWARAKGTDRDVLGHSFNVSEGGLFVRTLAPFAFGEETWLELVPPRTAHRVRLLASVVWRRPFGPIGAAVSPAGVGFRILGGLGDDERVYRDGCRALAADLGYGAKGDA